MARVQELVDGVQRITQTLAADLAATFHAGGQLLFVSVGETPRLPRAVVARVDFQILSAGHVGEDGRNGHLQFASE